MNDGIIKSGMQARRRMWMAALVALLLMLNAHAGLGESDAGQKSVQNVKDTTRNESIKASIEALDLLGQLSNPALAQKARQQLMAAADNLTDTAFRRLVGEVGKMSRQGLTDLVSKSDSGVLAYGQALARGSAAATEGARAIVAGSGDEAGAAAIRLLRKLEQGAGEVGAEEVKRLAAQLGPGRSKAFLGLIAKEAEKGAGRAALVKSLGTLVDGLFVLNDAVNIYYSEASAEEKAAAATGKAVEFGVSTAAGAGASALGAGLAPALVIGLSAMSVGELTKEAIGLYYDRQNAAMKEQWAAIELREMAIQRMLRVNELMKAGKVTEADAMYQKLRRFVFDHTTEMYGEPLSPSMDALQQKLTEAEDRLAANRVLNEARIPYNRALNWYGKGIYLTSALSEIGDARDILNGADESLRRFLAPAQGKVKTLEGLVRAAIANAAPLEISRVNVPSRIEPGEWARLEVYLSGGIPAYVDATGSGSAGGLLSVSVYWQAPKEPGTYSVGVRIRDDIKQTAEKEVPVVVGAMDTDTQTDTDSQPDTVPAADGETYKGSDAELLSGVWKVQGTCTSAYLGASLQYLSDSPKDIQEASNAMVGKTQPLPDVDLGLIRAMKSMFSVARDGDYYVITASGFTKEEGLGGNRYRIRFTSASTFVGTMEARSRFGKKTNEIAYDVQGKRASE